MTRLTWPATPASTTRSSSFRRKRRAIVAVWDFCRAVDDAVDEAAGRRTHAAQVSWRAGASELGAVLRRRRRRETPQGRALSRCIALHLPRPAFEALIDGVEMDLRTRRYATFDDSTVLHPCGSAVGLMCVEIFGYTESGVAAVRDRARRGAAAHEHPARRARRSGARPSASRSRTSTRFGCSEGDLGAERSPTRATACSRPAVKKLLAFQASGRATTTAVPTPHCRERSAPSRRRADHGRDLPRHPQPDRGGRLRRLQPRHPRAPPASAR